MQLLRSFGKRKPPHILFIFVPLLLVACTFQLIIAPPKVAHQPTSTPTLAPVATASFELPPTIVAPEYLEAELEIFEPFDDVEDCDYEVLDAVLAEATEIDREVNVDCNLTLDRNDVVTKRLIFETSGVTLECNGATITGGDGTSNSANNINYRRDMIEVRSRSRIEDRRRIWERPRSVTIRGCNIIGSIRVLGMARNGQGKLYTEEDGQTRNYFKESSRLEGHTERARANAPTNIVFDNLTITGVGRNPFYFAPGVSYSRLINSELKGESGAVGLYLDAESYANTIKNNYIHVSTKNYIFEQWDRPLIAIDGSSHNKILNNRFSNLSHGGIYLYRNCGEGGVVRHATPSYNHIINNVFYYNRYRGGNPSVYLGAHDYGWFQETFGFCHDDSVPDTITEVPFGSGISNKDHATHNVVMQNQIFVRSVSDMIKIQNPSVNSNNFIDYNHTVTDDTVVYNEPAVCYVADLYRRYLPHGAVRDVYPGPNNIPTCTTYQDTCFDGELLRSANTTCELTTEEFDCTIMGSNAGCTQTVSCPANQRIVGARAACNLEWGTISDASFSTVPGDIIKVFRPSDSVQSGICNIGSYHLRDGDLNIAGLQDSFALSVGCDEYDANGGDCQIRGVLYCR